MAGWKLPFEALVFDLGGVIVLHDNEALYRRLGARCAAPDAAVRIKREAEDPRYAIGALTIPTLHEALRHELGYRDDWAGFLADWCSHFTIDGAMLALVETLAAEHRVLLFSNTNREHWEFLCAATQGVLGRLEAHLSYELGAMKPFPEAFRRMAARAGIAPARSLFIDDLAVNVEGARRAGFQAELFTGRRALKQFLAAAQP
ncbi:MAG TPA: HAD-IA family hydrolase [Alphaproteobacteria bacterium]|nr:HAD-IA family hydrolase [Alphaproteobacteria bacterium]